MGKIRWEVGPMVRCDIIAYSGINYSGKRTQMRIFPTGSQQGGIDGGQMGSALLRAPAGVRMTLKSTPGEAWDREPWRAIEFHKATSIPSSVAKRLRAIRIPDLDYLDHFDAKTTNPTGSSSYPNAESLDAGEGWTYGRQRDGGLKGQIQVISLERQGVAVPPPPVAQDLMAMAKAIVASPQTPLRENVFDALVEQLVLAGMDEERARAYADKL
jgi:hypothetical protein